MKPFRHPSCSRVVREIAAADFFTTLFLIELKSRRVRVAGSTPFPGESFMRQVARNLTAAVDGFLLPHRFLICDRDGKFSDQFRRILSDAGVEIVLTPARAPNCSAYAERFVRSIKEECLARMILFGGASLRRALREYVEHYHRERPHQGLGTRSSIGRNRGRHLGASFL